MALLGEIDGLRKLGVTIGKNLLISDCAHLVLPYHRLLDEQQVVAQAEVKFVLKEMEGQATNVHYFGGVQFQQYGLHHVEIYLENELRMRFPLPVIQVKRSTG